MCAICQHHHSSLRARTTKMSIALFESCTALGAAGSKQLSIIAESSCRRKLAFTNNSLGQSLNLKPLRWKYIAHLHYCIQLQCPAWYHTSNGGIAWLQQLGSPDHWNQFPAAIWCGGEALFVRQCYQLGCCPAWSTPSQVNTGCFHPSEAVCGWKHSNRPIEGCLVLIEAAPVLGGQCSSPIRDPWNDVWARERVASSSHPRHYMGASFDHFITRHTSRHSRGSGAAKHGSCQSAPDHVLVCLRAVCHHILVWLKLVVVGSHHVGAGNVAGHKEGWGKLPAVAFSFLTWEFVCRVWKFAWGSHRNLVQNMVFPHSMMLEDKQHPTKSWLRRWRVQSSRFWSAGMRLRLLFTIPT